MTATDKKQQIVKIAIMVLVALFFYFFFFDFFLPKFRGKKNLGLLLEEMAKYINEQCPIDVEIKNSNEMIIEKVYFIKEKTIVYEFRILNYTKDDYNLIQLREDLIASTIEELESNESFTILRNHDVFFEYHYYDSKKEKMFEIKFLLNTPVVEVSTYSKPRKKKSFLEKSLNSAEQD